MKLNSIKVDYDPLCPYCEKPVREFHWRRIKANTQREYVFICPHCRKVLGITAAG